MVSIYEELLDEFLLKWFTSQFKLNMINIGNDVAILEVYALIHDSYV